MSNHYDTIVIGAGTAGCVVASRLSETSGHRVALIEAGPDFGPADNGHWPDAIRHSIYVETPFDWGYTTQIAGVTIPYTRGKVMGGSSSINAGGINWGLRQDYDEWESFGNPGWGFDGLLPSFQKVERLDNDDPPLRSRNGMLTVSRTTGTTPLLDAFGRAFQNAGMSYVRDISGPDDKEGIGLGTVNARAGIRYHASAAYIDPARDRPNLAILSDTHVERLIWNGGRAEGIVVNGGEDRWELTADRIVLAAGAVGSPVLLQRSGIGPADVLRPILGDVPLHDLPGVGRNLHDHFGVRVWYATTPGAYGRLGLPAQQPGRPIRNAIRLRLRSSDALDAFDLDVTGSHWGFRPDDPAEETIAFTFFLIHPKAEGSLVITSADPNAPPFIDSGIAPDEDLEAIANGIRWIRARMTDPAVREWIGAETIPGAGLNGAALREWIHSHISLYHHPTGTCKLGPASDPLAVVDGTGRVHGFENLSVVDASTMPTIPRGMINLTVYAMAEKFADALNR